MSLGELMDKDVLLSSISHFAVFSTCSFLAMLKYSSCLDICSFCTNEWNCPCVVMFVSMDCIWLTMSSWVASFWGFTRGCECRHLRFSSKDLNSSDEMYPSNPSVVLPPRIAERLLENCLSPLLSLILWCFDLWLAGSSSCKFSKNSHHDVWLWNKIKYTNKKNQFFIIILDQVSADLWCQVLMHVMHQPLIKAWSTLWMMRFRHIFEPLTRLLIHLVILWRSNVNAKY